MRKSSGAFSGKFSGLYREMCEKAKWLQDKWMPRENDYYCKRKDWSDGPAEFLYTIEVPKVEEEIKDFKSRYIWLPRSFQIKERMLGGETENLRELAESRYYNEFLKDDKKIEDIKDKFKDKVDNIWNVVALIFYMEYEFDRIWDYDRDKWVDMRD